MKFTSLLFVVFLMSCDKNIHNKDIPKVVKSSAPVVEYCYIEHDLGLYFLMGHITSDHYAKPMFAYSSNASDLLEVAKQIKCPMLNMGTQKSR